ncbi:uncharacterized protein LOC112182654 [Rosa chinensis]|uniref:uncharacterized protein LOC112182654 n=1 Tax=Rosa chinensis TaxID=74649 RepID=UPI001AD8DCEE|nr:uncharacterized protein LOC112182654 [Rosa chinensis]
MVRLVYVVLFRNLDGIILEEEDRGHKSRSAKGPAVEEILKMHDKATHRWNTFFIIVCAFAVFIDPLFCYIHVIWEHRMCFHYDWTLVWTYIGLRTAVDVFYIIDIIIFFCGICKKRQGKKFGACWKARNDQQTVLALKEVIKKRYLLPLSILPRILVSLPIPEGLVGLALMSVYFDPIYVIIIITPFQYTLRIFLIYGSQRWLPIKKTATGRWLKPLLDFLPFILASHESRARSYHLKLNEKKHLMKPDIDLWLSKNDLSELKTMTKDSKDLKTMTKKKKTLKTVIIENIDKLEENKDINVRNIISILPIKFKRSLIRLLCLASLKKVSMLANLNEEMLKEICEHLKPVIYTEDNYIVEKGKPLGMMLFITQGLGWSYTTNNVNGGGTNCGSSTNKWLRRGDFYGEELLNWAFKCPSFTDLPISTRTVVSQEKVEAFALRASDLKSIVCKFWWHFIRELEQANLEQWENSAASSIQGAWRNRLARARHSNRWDKFTVEY